MDRGFLLPHESSTLECISEYEFWLKHYYLSEDLNGMFNSVGDAQEYLVRNYGLFVQ